MSSVVSTSYPRSRASGPQASETIVRSRAWDDDIARDWNSPITGLESIAERTERYQQYYNLTVSQLKLLVTKFRSGLESAIQRRQQRQMELIEGEAPGILILDSYIKSETFMEAYEMVKGMCVAVEFVGCKIRAAKVEVNSAKAIAIPLLKEPLLLTAVKRDVYRKGLTDRSATASDLFDAIASIIPVDTNNMNIGLSVGFPCKQRGQDNAVLLRWTRNMQTGRDTIDPVEGADMAALLECAITRRQGSASVTRVANDAIAVMVAGLALRNNFIKQPKLALNWDEGVNAALVLPTILPRLTGDIVTVDIGSFDTALPINDVDLEIDFADPSSQGLNLLDKMMGSAYLGELCRRTIVKVWQNEAPPLAWTRRSLPWTACVSIILDDESSGFLVTEEILKGAWDWETTESERRIVRLLFKCVFDRAAALVAVIIASLSRATGYFQAAMGGFTCIISGEAAKDYPPFMSTVRETLDAVLEEQGKLIELQYIKDGSLVGTAALTISNPE